MCVCKSLHHGRDGPSEGPVPPPRHTHPKSNWSRTRRNGSWDETTSCRRLAVRNLEAPLFFIGVSLAPLHLTRKPSSVYSCQKYMQGCLSSQSLADWTDPQPFVEKTPLSLMHMLSVQRAMCCSQHCYNIIDRNPFPPLTSMTCPFFSGLRTVHEYVHLPLCPLLRRRDWMPREPVFK